MKRSVDFFQTVYEREARQSGYEGGDPAAWQTAARATLSRLLGLERLTPAPADARMLSRVQRDGYTAEDWVMTPEEGEEMPFYLLRPDGLGDKKVPVILAPHGHGFGGRAATAGETDDPEILARIDEANADYGRKLAQRGALVFCPDARGMGDRRADTGLPLEDQCLEISHLALPLGRTVAGMWVFDLMRLCDLALTDPNADPARAGCIGLSGGGWQTLLLAALDTRISAAVVSGYFYGFKQSLLQMYYNCACNYVPDLWRHFDAGDIAAMIAPRALGLETGARDDLNGPGGLDNVYPQIEIAKRAYAAAGAEENLAHFVFDGAHRFHGQESMDFLLRALQHSDIE